MPNLYKRVLPIEKTHRNLQKLMPAVGVTNVIELTALDTLGLPVCLAFGPLPEGCDLPSLAKLATRSAQRASAPILSSDQLEQVWASMESFPRLPGADRLPPVTAAGKGLAAMDARVSAMMEAVERYSARWVSSPTRFASYSEMAKQVGEDGVINPEEFALLSPTTFDPEQPLDWVEGQEINNGQPVWVPDEVATFLGDFRAQDRTFVDSPTGLGAGNVLEEAISHGLAEAIEHDAWILAVARQIFSGTERGLLNELFRKTIPNLEHDWQEASFRPVDLQALGQLVELNGWFNKTQETGTWLKIHDITSDLGITVISASMGGIKNGPDGGGLGAHPDARAALARSLTEAAQQRLILGLQRLMQAAGLPSPTKISQPTQAKPVGEPVPERIFNWAVLAWEDPAHGADAGKIIHFEELPSATLPTIQEDIQYMIRALERRGYSRAIYVNLEKPNLNTPVVKVIVPGLADHWNSSAPPGWRAILKRMQPNSAR